MKETTQNQEAPVFSNTVLDAHYSSVHDIPKFPSCRHTPTWSWNDIQKLFLKSDRIINLNPDYQRGYVWTQDQKERFIEFKLKGGIGGNILYWNYPNQVDDIGESDWHNTYELVDGKQRLNAVLGFLNNEVKAFGKYLSEYSDAKLAMKRQTYYFDFHINNLATKREVVEWYLGLNNGGTVHTKNAMP